MRIRELAESIKIYSLSDIKFDCCKLNAIGKQLKVYLSPVNIGNAVYHGKLSKDVKF